MPGDNVKMTVELIAPIAMDEGFASRSVKAAAPLVLASLRKSLSKKDSYESKKERKRPLRFLSFALIRAVLNEPWLSDFVECVAQNNGPQFLGVDTQ